MSPKVVEALQNALHHELVSITQYTSHHEVFESMGYPGLSKMLFDDAKGEMAHYEQIADRLLFLDVMPRAKGKIEPLLLDPPDIVKMLEADRELESAAITEYNEAIRLCFKENDHGSRGLFEKMLVEEETHYDNLDRLLKLIETHGAPYLARLAAQPPEMGAGGA
ncbi:MAG: hypothetical protein HY719_16010 [Planctomycetes bacterium]|nr:hypothetical protein [Planctomycetota bacterium]